MKSKLYLRANLFEVKMKSTWNKNGKKEILLETQNIATIYRHKSIYDQIAKDNLTEHNKDEIIKDVKIENE